MLNILGKKGLRRRGWVLCPLEACIDLRKGSDHWIGEDGIYYETLEWQPRPGLLTFTVCPLPHSSMKGFLFLLLPPPSHEESQEPWMPTPT